MNGTSNQADSNADLPEWLQLDLDAQATDAIPYVGRARSAFDFYRASDTGKSALAAVRTEFLAAQSALGNTPTDSEVTSHVNHSLNQLYHSLPLDEREVFESFSAAEKSDLASQRKALAEAAATDAPENIQRKRLTGIE